MKFRSNTLKDKAPNNNPLPANEALRGTGIPIFQQYEIMETSHFLDQLIRGILIRLKITKEDFQELYKQYSVEILGVTHQKATENKRNLTRQLKQGMITPMVFQRTLSVLGLYLQDVKISVEDIDHNEKTFTLSDIRQQVKDK